MILNNSTQLFRLRLNISKLEETLANYIKSDTDASIIRPGGDKPIPLVAIPPGLGIYDLARLLYYPEAKSMSDFTKYDNWFFFIDRRPFNNDNSIWKLAYIENPTGSFAVVYDILKDTYDYLHCASNDALTIDECQHIMDLKLKQELEDFCKENAILNLTPEYKQFMKEVYTGEIDLLKNIGDNN